jgi:hypothetical protein
MAARKNKAAVALNRLRNKKLSPKERSEIAAQAAAARNTKLTPEQRREIARRAGLAGGRGRKKRKVD